jgi:hypothetical protein
MTVQRALSPERLAAKAEQMQTLATLIHEYPAEAQLIMLAIEDGLTLGPVQIAQNTAPTVIRMDESGNLHAPAGAESRPIHDEGSDRRQSAATVARETKV